jgi:integrase
MSNKSKRNKVLNGIAYTGKSWSYVLRIPDLKTGKTKPKWVGGFNSKESALLARDKARVALRQSNYVEPTGITVGEWLIKWATQIHITKVNRSTYRSYLHNINNHLIPALGDIVLSKLMPSDVERYYASALNKVGRYGKTLSRRTVEYHGTILRNALNYAVNTEGLLAVNQASKVSLIRPDTKTPTPWSLKELKTFLDEASKHRLYFYYRLIAYTGARRGELLALKWADFDGKRIAITKSGLTTNKTKGGDGRRYISLDADTIEQFNSHRKRQITERLYMGSSWTETGYVFIREDGKPLDEGTVTRLFSKLLKRAGLRHNRLHDLRHLHATELLRLGEPLHVVSKRLGHADPMVTATIYAHVTDEQADTTSTTFANSANSA